MQKQINTIVYIVFMLHLIFFANVSYCEENATVEPLVRLYQSMNANSSPEIEKGILQFINRRNEEAAGWTCIKTLEPIATKTNDPFLNLLIGFAASERNLYKYSQGFLEKAKGGLADGNAELVFACNYWLGRAYLGQGMDGDADKVLSDAIKIGDNLINSENQCVFWKGSKLSRSFIQSMVARLYFDYQKNEQAIAIYEKINDFEAKQSYRPSGTLALDMARCYSALNRHKEALDKYKEAIKDPNLNACDRCHPHEMFLQKRDLIGAVIRLLLTERYPS